jgi:hypothetical protein
MNDFNIFNENPNESVSIRDIQSNTPRNVKVLRLYLHEVTQQNFQYIRPYMTNLTNETSELVKRCFEENIPIKRETISGTANEFVIPSTEHKGVIEIVNGWNERRFIFMMEIEINSYMGTTTEIINGYTDAMRVSNLTGVNAHIDPNMIFYINSSMTLRTVRQQTINGERNVYSVFNSSHVLSNNHYYNSGDGKTLYSADSGNLLGNMQDIQSNLYSSIDQNDIIRVSEVIGSGPIVSPRIDSSAADYVANILEPARINLKDEYINPNSSRSSFCDIFGKIRGGISSNTQNANSFLKILMNQSGNKRSDFTYGELLRLDPNVDNDNVTTIVFRANSSIDRAANPDIYITPQDSKTTDDNSIYTQTANILGNAIPSILLQYGVTSITFRASNKTTNGQILVSISQINGINQELIRNNIDCIRATLESGIFNDISYSNKLEFDISMICNAFIDTILKISFNGEPPIPYVIPTFCDSLMRPTVTNEREDIKQIANDFVSLVGAMDQVPYEYGNNGYYGRNGDDDNVLWLEDDGHDSYYNNHNHSFYDDDIDSDVF